MHHQHCMNCIRPCNYEHCRYITCPFKCTFIFHECKLDEHLNETCPNREVNCSNYTNGCRIRVKRNDLIRHLEKCPANVVQCSSFRMRKILNKYEKNKHLKHPDPIDVRPRMCTNLNDVLLKQDYETLNKFCNENPLKFQRMYGHLIGLKLNPNSSEFRFSFLNLLLKTVKSRVFKDIEAENCIVFNDDVGCSACQTRIKYLEMARFEKLKKDRYHFDQVLREVYTYEDFMEKQVYKDSKFLEVYEEFFLKPNRDENQPKKYESKETKEELDKKLKETNQKLLDSIELNPIMKLNVAKELPCDAFQITYESYRINDHYFSCDCNELLRRDEFSQHYNLYHNFILNYSDLIHKQCPFSEYGCNFYKQTYDFMFTSKYDRCDNLEKHSLNANLVHNKLTNQITFKLDNLNFEKGDFDYSLLDLPFDILYEIFDKLDSLSLYTLSITSKGMRDLCEQFLSLRGIVYPKWVKKDEFESDRNNNDLKTSKKWIIEKYVYSFTRHIEPPKRIRIKNLDNNYNQHVQNCSFRVCRELNEPFKIFPPYTTKQK